MNNLNNVPAITLGRIHAPEQQEMHGNAESRHGQPRCGERVSDSCSSHPGKVACCLAATATVVAAFPVPHPVCNENGDGGMKCELPLASVYLSRVPTCTGVVYSAQPLNASECSKDK
jgi:hypothetical protein